MNAGITRPRLHRGRSTPPAVVFVYGFAAFILIGALLLMLPICSAGGHWTSFPDSLFTATSAVCVNGLVVVDTGTYWSGVGQVVIVALIQAGGLGFMTSSTLLLLLLRRQATLRDRVLLNEALGEVRPGYAFRLARKIIIFTAAVEIVGFLILTTSFAPRVGMPRALWWGVFHAVSAFNDAGFDLIGKYRSLVPYDHEPAILLTFAGLLMLGGISYTVVEDVIQRRGRFSRLTLDTKLVLVTTAGLIVLGTLGILFTERANPGTLGSFDGGTRLLNAFFQAVSPRTAGFASIDIAKMTEDGLVVMIGLMFIGGAAGSTAGGIKVQTFSVLLFAMISSVRGSTEVVAFGRRIPTPLVLRAIAVSFLSLSLVFLVSLSLTLTEHLPYVQLLFETVSAFSTTGLSAGLTPHLSLAAHLILIFTMFAGRLGPLTLALALASRERRPSYRLPEEGVKIG